jgi:hypothetical protein
LERHFDAPDPHFFSIRRDAAAAAPPTANSTSTFDAHPSGTTRTIETTSGETTQSEDDPVKRHQVGIMLKNIGRKLGVQMENHELQHDVALVIDWRRMKFLLRKKGKEQKEKQGIMLEMKILNDSRLNGMNNKVDNNHLIHQQS